MRLSAADQATIVRTVQGVAGPLATRNAQHFEGLTVAVVNPWAA